MHCEILPGKYVVAVSGGVDSVVLLDLLRQQPELDLVVAHFDHGIRPDSSQDRDFVQTCAEKYGLPFAFAEGNLGADASEATARAARYSFLQKTMQDTGARAIITAHHQDDALETAIINMTRGTGRRGLTSLRDTLTIKRPLLAYSKSGILNYAQQHGLEWHEDSTNTDQKYLRNYIRLTVLPKFSTQGKQALLDTMQSLQTLNAQIDDGLAELLTDQPGDNLSRQLFASLPDDVARELLAAWLRQKGIGFERRTLERAVAAIKTQRNGSSVPIKGNYYLNIGRDEVALTRV